MRTSACLRRPRRYGDPVATAPGAKRFLPVIVAIISLLWFGPGSAAAHPLGNFTINHFARITLERGKVRVRYVVDLAEISTLQELQSAGVSDPNAPTQKELNDYCDRLAAVYPGGIELYIDEHPVLLNCRSKAISLLEGAGGLKTLRAEFDFEGEFPFTPIAAQALRFADNNHRERIGWHELVVCGGSGMSIFNSSAYGSAVTDELKAYPQDALAAPLNERTCNLSFTGGALPGNARALQTRDGARIVPARDRLAELIAVPKITPLVALVGLLIAAFLGSLHAMSPGHGKTIVGAYLVGSRGTAKHAAFLGLTVTITHTAGVFALGLVTLFASHYIVPERLYPILSFLSGSMVVAIGIRLMITRFRRAFAAGRNQIEAHSHQGHEHPDGDAHMHGPDHTHERDHAHGHDHPHGHDHAHGHDHPHGHDHGHEDHSGVDSSLGYHSHGGIVHTHMPPGADGGRVSWRSLLALGVSGGLLPCPSALIVLLAAISLHRVGYGLLLVISFSAGLAAMLTSVGLLFVYAGRILKRCVQPGESGGLRFGGAGNLVRLLPAGSAFVVTLAGAAICYEALAQAGVRLSSLAGQVGSSGPMSGLAIGIGLATLCVGIVMRRRRVSAPGV